MKGYRKKRMGQDSFRIDSMVVFRQLEWTFMARAEQGSLFDETGASASGAEERVVATPRPLAVRMRPQCLGEVVGHEHLLGKDSLLPRLIASDRFGSLLFYGPPGSGKTTMAEVIAELEFDASCDRYR